MNSNTCTNKYNYKYSNLFILILVPINIITLIHIQIIVYFLYTCMNKSNYSYICMNTFVKKT